jgi:hypothetical protein
MIRDQRLRRPGQFVEMVEHGDAVDQHLAIVENEGGDAAEGVELGDPLGVAEARPRAVLEVDAIEPQGDADAADVGRIELADEDQVQAPDWIGRIMRRQRVPLNRG